MNFTELSKQKTYKQIIEQIISLIVNGELKSGDKLPGERALADMLSTSRASIREAFRTLEILGILEVRHGGGTYVHDFQISPFLDAILPLFLKDIDVMGDMMDFRIMLEGEAVKAAATSNRPGTISGLEESLSKMKSEDFDIAEQADIDFHMSIFAATGNKVYMLAGECLSYILRTSVHTNRTNFMNNKSITDKWYDEHVNILQAIKDHDPDQAYQHLHDHLEDVRQFTLKTIPGSNSDN